MDYLKSCGILKFEAVKWLYQYIILRNNLRNVMLVGFCGGSSVIIGSILYPILKRKCDSFLIARHSNLPIGLSNNNNVCYLNALLQAMAANRSLVTSLKRSAAIRRDRILCCLVALLEGLRCSASYLKKHNLIEVLTETHATLIDELTMTNRWPRNEQQDVHELFSFFMNLANGSEIGRTAIRASEGLHSASRILCRSGDSTVARCCHRNSPFISGLKLNSPIDLTETLRNTKFHTLKMATAQHHLITTQVICTKCSYRGAVKLVPEASVTLFPYEFKKMQRPIGYFNSDQHELFNVDQLLNSQFCIAERLTGINCPRCHIKSMMPPLNLLQDITPTLDKQFVRNLAESECKNTCVLRHWMAHLPPCLVLYVQRAFWKKPHHIRPDSDLYIMNHSNDVLVKYIDPVIFPCHLDMSTYMRSGRAVTNGIVDQVEDYSPGSNNQSVDSPDKEKSISKRIPRPYVLRSVVVHQGLSLHAGHYVAYRAWKKENDSDKSHWLYTSDRHVARTPLENVMACQAYMLFYEREDSHRTDCPYLSSECKSTVYEKKERCQRLDDQSLSQFDDDEGLDNDDEEEALDLFEGLSRAERIQTLARAVDSDIA